MSQAVTGANDGQKRIKKTDNVWGWLVKWIPLWLTPNHLSAMRMFLVLPIILLIWLHFYKTALFCCFFPSLLLDWLDGAMARLRSQESSLGAILDPIADKIVNFAIFLAFLFHVNASIYKWLILPILLIDAILFFVAMGKYFIKEILPKLSPDGWLYAWLNPPLIQKTVKVEKTGANNFGKTKLVLQGIGLSFLLLFDPQATYFLYTQLVIPGNFTILEIAIPLLLACSVFGALSLWGHLKVVHLQK